jgi:hypothetical protein
LKARCRPVLIAFLVSLIAVSILAGCGSSVPPLSPSAVVQQIYQYRFEKDMSNEAWNKVAANDFVKGFDTRRLLPLRGSVLSHTLGYLIVGYSIDKAEAGAIQWGGPVRIPTTLETIESEIKANTPYRKKNMASVFVTETIARLTPTTAAAREQPQTVIYTLTKQNGAWKISNVAINPLGVIPP